MITGKEAVITVKDLAREFDRRPRWLRSILRRHFTRGVGCRWEWDEGEGRKVREWIARYLNGDVK